MFAFAASESYESEFILLLNMPLVCHCLCVIMVFISTLFFLPDTVHCMSSDAIVAETKDETEEPVDLIPTLIPLPPDEVCICIETLCVVCTCHHHYHNILR